MKEEVLKLAKEIMEKDPSLTEWISTKFPELKESEDERIRKEIISAVNIYCSEYSRGAKIREEMLAWLEKKGEQKQLKKIEQKTVWSEEDKFNLSDIEAMIHTMKGDGLNADRLINWLKSLKDRIHPQPQPKQEWSEKDLYMQKQAIKCVNNSGKLEVSTEEIEDWLKNMCTYNPYKAVVESIAEMCKHYDKATDLQDFYDNVKVKCKDAIDYDSLFPRKQWKPSEYQLKSLQAAIDIIGEQTLTGTDLKELSEDLKKLMEE